ncbi:MAG: nicotinate-nucleotide diphosphorylase (carboxylating), partial [Polaromonas sp.]|nr:nicotinate-nucleotide diphosphorylase (carboxylating) [Polaromonas sp.]
MKKSFNFSAEALAQLAQSDVARALAEDVGAGDLTAALIDPATQARARVLARESAVVCGSAWVEAAL